MAKLVLIRHGQSEWNLSNLFTGWVDVDLSERVLNKQKPPVRRSRNTGWNLITPTLLF